MATVQTTLTQKGQVTIPQALRTKLGLRPRDKVVFELEGDAVRIRRADSKVMAGYGAVKPRKRPEDFRALREEFEEQVAEEVTGEA